MTDRSNPYQSAGTNFVSWTMPLKDETGKAFADRLTYLLGVAGTAEDFWDILSRTSTRGVTWSPFLPDLISGLKRLSGSECEALRSRLIKAGAALDEPVIRLLEELDILEEEDVAKFLAKLESSQAEQAVA